MTETLHINTISHLSVLTAAKMTSSIHNPTLLHQYEEKSNKICEFWKKFKSVSKKNLILLVIILITIKLHMIFYACTSLIDKYCEKEMCGYKCRKF
jgi:hypothetical protein